MPRDFAEPESLPEYFLRMANGDARAALEAACATLEVLASRLSHGYPRLPPSCPVMPPKPRVEAIL